MQKNTSLIVVTHTTSEGPKWHSNKIIINAFLESLKVINYKALIDIEDLPNLPHSNSEKEKIVLLFTSKILPKHIDLIKAKILKPIFIIPIFGNLTSLPTRWITILDKLQGEKVKFTFASNASLLQGKKLLQPNCCFLLKYPISKLFLHEETPKKQNEQVIFHFDGRMNSAKGFYTTLSAFTNALKVRKDIELHCIGKFDPWCYPLHGYTDNLERFKENLLFFKQFKQIVFHSYLDQESYKKFLERSHCLISPSTFHDDDFSVSTIQSLACGNEAILTNWGGLKDYGLFHRVDFLSVTTGKSNIPQVSIAALTKLILGFTPSPANQLINCKSTIMEYSHQAYHKRLNSIINNETQQFMGASKLYQEYGYKFKNDPYVLSKDTRLYEKIYRSYC